MTQSTLVFVCTTCNAHLVGIDAQDKHSKQTGHSNYDFAEQEVENTAAVIFEKNEKSTSGLSDLLSSRVTLKKRTWLRLKKIQKFYRLENINDAFTKAVNATFENIEKLPIRAKSNAAKA